MTASMLKDRPQKSTTQKPAEKSSLHASALAPLAELLGEVEPSKSGLIRSKKKRRQVEAVIFEQMKLAMPDIVAELARQMNVAPEALARDLDPYILTLSLNTATREISDALGHAATKAGHFEKLFD